MRCPSTSGAARFNESSSASGVGPPAASMASTTRAGRAHVVDPGSGDRAGDVDHERRRRRPPVVGHGERRRRRRTRRDGQRRFGGRRWRAHQQPRATDHDDDGHGGGDQAGDPEPLDPGPRRLADGPRWARPRRELRHGDLLGSAASSDAGNGSGEVGAPEGSGRRPDPAYPAHLVKFRRPQSAETSRDRVGRRQ